MEYEKQNSVTRFWNLGKVCSDLTLLTRTFNSCSSKGWKVSDNSLVSLSTVWSRDYVYSISEAGSVSIFK